MKPKTIEALDALLALGDAEKGDRASPQCPHGSYLIADSFSPEVRDRLEAAGLIDAHKHYKYESKTESVWYGSLSKGAGDIVYQRIKKTERL